MDIHVTNVTQAQREACEVVNRVDFQTDCLAATSGRDAGYLYDFGKSFCACEQDTGKGHVVIELT